ncbi:MAG: DUF11 domain-containing protein, partial [Anaerolineales bacterium]|nr:DUF11 domain-containing protein [Anaerolineales bacterium]
FEFKFARGTWDTVEKEADGNTEIGNRQLTVDYGTTGTQVVNLTVANWRDPFVVAHTPAAGASGVDPNTIVSLTWNQAMPSDTDFAVTGLTGVVSGTFSYDPGSFAVIFTPTQALDPAATYTVSATGKVDAGGDVQQFPTTFTFSTPGADLEVTMADSADPVLVGSVFTYTVTVNNLGPDTVTANLTNTLPAGLDYLSNDAGCAETSGVVTCSFENLAGSSSAVVQITVATIQTGTFTNTAIVTAPAFDPNLSNNTIAETTTVTELSADLEITLSDMPDPITVGETTLYRITITNAGPDAATNVILTDILPEGLTYVSDNSGCSEVDGTVTCTLGTLASGDSFVVHITVTAEQVGIWTNSATVSSESIDPNMSNNTISEETTVLEAEPDEFTLYLPLIAK